MSAPSVEGSMLRLQLTLRQEKVLELASGMVLVARAGALLEGLFAASDEHINHRPVFRDVIGRVGFVTRETRRFAGSLNAGSIEVAVGTLLDGGVQTIGPR